MKLSFNTINLTPRNFQQNQTLASKSKVSFGELDDGGNGDYSYYNYPRTQYKEGSKEYKRAMIDAEYKEAFAELCDKADAIGMDNSVFWAQEKKLAAERNRKLRNLEELY